MEIIKVKVRLLCALIRNGSAFRMESGTIELEPRLKVNAELEPELEVELSLVEEEYFGEREERTHDDSESEDDGFSDETDSNPGTNTLLEMRELDEKEVQIVRQFSKDTCVCTKKQGVPCSGYFTESELGRIRMSMAELESDQLDLVILSQLNAHHYSGDLVGHRTKAEKSKRTDREKNYSFYYQGCSICLKTFLFIYNIGKKRFRNLVKHHQLNGISPRMHCNVKHRPWNAATFAEKEQAITFIKNFTEVHALRLPGRMPAFYDYNIMLLPTDVSKASVHRDYVKATSQQGMRCFG